MPCIKQKSRRTRKIYCLSTEQRRKSCTQYLPQDKKCRRARHQSYRQSTRQAVADFSTRGRYKTLVILVINNIVFVVFSSIIIILTLVIIVIAVNTTTTISTIMTRYRRPQSCKYDTYRVRSRRSQARIIKHFYKLLLSE